MRLSAALAFTLLGATPGLAAVDAVNIYEPRAFGYFIGDTLERHVEVITSGDTEFLTSSLPRPGALTYWLDLVTIDDKVTESGGRKTHDITLKYQIFYSALDARKMDIPSFPLKFRSAGSESTDVSPEPGDAQAPLPDASVPSLGILVSPLRDIVLSDVMAKQSKDIADVLRPDTQPRQISTQWVTTLLFGSLAAFAASIILLLWQYAKGPFARRPGRPFTIANRRIRDIQLAPQSEASYRDSLLILHRAFDQSFGRRLFAGDVQAFLGAHKRFSGLEPSLVRFFESSRLYFFSGDRAAAQTRFPIEDVNRLAADMAHEERTAP